VLEDFIPSFEYKFSATISVTEFNLMERQSSMFSLSKVDYNLSFVLGKLLKMINFGDLICGYVCLFQCDQYNHQDTRLRMLS
jgi:hypothetical protein